MKKSLLIVYRFNSLLETGRTVTTLITPLQNCWLIFNLFKLKRQKSFGQSKCNFLNVVVEAFSFNCDFTVNYPSVNKLRCSEKSFR